MRLTIAILIASFMQISAATFAQRISISKSNAPLELLLKEVRRQTGFDVLFDGKDISRSPKVSLSVTNATIEETLSRMLQGSNLSYNISGKIITIKKKESSILGRVIEMFTDIDVRGKVRDAEGKDLAGATVKVIGSRITATTNEKGEFYIPGVDENAVLQINYIGYNTREVMAKEVKINAPISLEISSAKLDEVSVVSTGYQTLSKERTTGSFSQVGRETLDRRPVSNLSTALQGKVAGMQARENEDGSVSFLIRGNSSLYADGNPLVVVDGFPVSNSDFSNINPNDVESVTVLKDAAAASIWGARAANGVIVVVTKKAKVNGRLSVEGSVFTRVSSKVNLDQVLNQANSADHVRYEKTAYANNWSFLPYANSFFDIIYPLTLAQELLYANEYGQLTTEAMNAGLDRLSQINNRDQIKDLLLQNAITNQYNANFQYGSDKVKSYTSILYENNRGGSKRNGYDRFNLNFNNDFKLANFLNFYLSGNLQYQSQDNSGATLAEIRGISPYEVLLNPDGSYGTNLNTYNRYQLSLIPTSRFPYSDWSYNLLREVNGRSLKSNAYSARIQTGFNAKLLPGLTFDTKFQYERSSSSYNDYYSEDTFFTRNLINSRTVYNNNTQVVGRSVVPMGGILKGRSVSINNATIDANAVNLESFLARNQFNYDKRFGIKHSLTAIAGMEISQNTTSYRANPYVYGYNPDKLQASVPQYGYGSSVDQFTDFMGNPTTIPGGNTTFGWERNRFVSFYGNASYTYNNKYSLSGSVRSDASNFITDNASLRWSPLWSVGAKWNMKNESFMDKITAVNRLEVRLTYGENGNVEKSTSTKALLNIGTSLNANTGTIIGTVSDYGNPSLRWEKTATTNLGIDFAVLDNKLFGSIDLYSKLGKDIVGNIALPSVTGTKLQKFNNAEISNKGIELSLGTNLPIGNSGLNYSTSLNYAYNKNVIKDLFNPSLYVYQLAMGEFVEGRPVNSIYSFTYLGMLNGVPQYQGPNGSTQSFNDVSLYNRGLGLPFMNYEGTATPPHTFGWTNNFSFKGFTLSAILIGKMGGVYRNPTFDYGAEVGTRKTVVNSFFSDVLAGDSRIPALGLKNDPNLYLWERYVPNLNTLVESSSYFELKELTLEYQLSERLAKAMHLSRLRVFAQSRDLGLIWSANSRGYNPDWLPGTNRPVQTYTFGINFQL